MAMLLLLARGPQRAPASLGRVAASLFPCSSLSARALSSSPPFQGQWAGKSREFQDRRPPRKDESRGRGGRQAFGRGSWDRRSSRSEEQDDGWTPRRQDEGQWAGDRGRGSQRDRREERAGGRGGRQAFGNGLWDKRSTRTEALDDESAPPRWDGGDRADGRGREAHHRREQRTGGRGDRQPFGRGARERGSPRTETRNGEPIPQLQGEGVYGLHSVLQALESRHRPAHTLFLRDPATLQDSGKRKSATEVQALDRIKALAAEIGVPVSYTSKWMLNHITSDKPHQGVVLDAGAVRLEEFVPTDPSTFVTSSRQPVILALDEIHDPQNFGAILRSAHFLGCSAVIVSERNSAPLSPAASRASVGALEVLAANSKLFKSRNLHEALAVSGDMGWRVVGASSGSNSVAATALGSDQPTILVMGNEHRGLRKGIRQTCSDIVAIPGFATDSETLVDSLNVSVASAILLYELLHH